MGYIVCAGNFKRMFFFIQRDTALQLDWLNRVKESHGSVELNAIANAQAINAKGIYSVGNIGDNRKVSRCKN